MISFFIRRKRKKSSSMYTFMSILLIIAALYLVKFISPNRDVVYPDVLYYNSIKYRYVDTISEFPLKFIRRRKMSYEGHSLLIHSSEKNQNPPKQVYIFLGSRKYRRYKLVN
jgi:hypothetical protein